MTEENKLANAALERAHGVTALQEARHLLAAGFARGAVNRAYYAAFHAARALLMAQGIQARSHDGLRRMLALHFVRTGRMNPDTAEILSRLATKREDSDYASDLPVSRIQAEEAVAQAESFLQSVDGMPGKP